MTNEEFDLCRYSNDVAKIFGFIDNQLMFGPKKVALSIARDFLLGTQSGSLPSFINSIDTTSAVFLHTFGFAGLPQPKDHSNCICHDKLKKAVLFMNTTDPDLERHVERFQEAQPEATYREAAQFVLNVVRERVVTSTGRKAAPSVSFQSRSLIADVDDAEDVPMFYVSNSGHPPPLGR